MAISNSRRDRVAVPRLHDHYPTGEIGHQGGFQWCRPQQRERERMCRSPCRQRTGHIGHLVGAVDGDLCIMPSLSKRHIPKLPRVIRRNFAPSSSNKPGARGRAAASDSRRWGLPAVLRPPLRWVWHHRDQCKFCQPIAAVAQDDHSIPTHRVPYPSSTSEGKTAP